MDTTQPRLAAATDWAHCMWSVYACLSVQRDANTPTTTTPTTTPTTPLSPTTPTQPSSPPTNLLSAIPPSPFTPTGSTTAPPAVSTALAQHARVLARFLGEADTDGRVLADPPTTATTADRPAALVALEQSTAVLQCLCSGAHGQLTLLREATMRLNAILNATAATTASDAATGASPLPPDVAAALRDYVGESTAEAVDWTRNRLRVLTMALATSAAGDLDGVRASLLLARTLEVAADEVAEKGRERGDLDEATSAAEAMVDEWLVAALTDRLATTHKGTARQRRHRHKQGSPAASPYSTPKRPPTKSVLSPSTRHNVK